MVFITEMKSVYSAVRTGSLNKAVFKGLRGGERDVRKWCRLTINLEDGIRRPLRRLEVGHFARTFVS